MYKITALGLALVFSVVALTASAQTPAVSCSGAVTGSQIMWSASVTGGVSPFTYLWNSGATSSTQTVTYNTPGVYVANLSVTDASSTVRMTACVARVLATSTLPIINNCQATSSVPVAVNSMLNIGPRGNVDAQGLEVLTVSSGSFTASVWGITYTVNSTKVVTVGNYVRLTGKISTTSPLVINAHNVKEQKSTKVVKNPQCIFDREHGWGWILKKDLQNRLKELKNRERDARRDLQNRNR